MREHTVVLCPIPTNAVPAVDVTSAILIKNLLGFFTLRIGGVLHK